MKVQVDLVKAVLGFDSGDIYWPKYLEKVTDDEDNLIPLTSWELNDKFTNYLFEHEYVSEAGGEPSMGMEVTVEIPNMATLDMVKEDFAAYLDEWNADMKAREAEVMQWHETLTETRDPMGLADNDIMI